MKKKWTILAAILIVVAIVAYTTYDNNKKQDAATADILNKVAQVDSIKITHKKDTLTLKGNKAKLFVEERPLVHIEKLERPDRKLFKKAPTYTIHYFVKGKELYYVELLPMEEKPSDDHLADFLINEQFLVKWGDFQMMFSQHERIEELLQYYQEKNI
ncbi:MAG: hypothetical protein KBT36_06010 [Kurthia sp.]|nr:hypothetical protein [Candidatus Kurthia equi]